MKVIKITIVLFTILSSFTSLIFAKQEPKEKFSKEYFTRMLENEKIFLWKIVKTSNDEDGFKSLKILDEAENLDFLIQENTNYGLTFTVNNIDYRLSQDNACFIINQSVEKIQKVLKNKIMCAFNIRGSDAYMLVIGDNNNEIVKEIKMEKQNKTKFHPSWYDYKVN